MINDLIALNHATLNQHNGHIERMDTELQNLFVQKQELMTRAENLEKEREVLIHEYKLLKQTLDILENK